MNDLLKYMGLVCGVAIVAMLLHRETAAAWPPDPGGNIPWSCGSADVTGITCAFNAARAVESPSLSAIAMPSQAQWDAMSPGEKAFWLINQERIDRGLYALHAIEENVTNIAQTYNPGEPQTATLTIDQGVVVSFHFVIR